ncbi:MAG: CHAD domain-containing protein [Acidobacteria bacterium]|nr:CHAD domain-containing protein [Acidobacteriota bacterium]
MEQHRQEEELSFARKVLADRSADLLDKLSALKRRIQEESIHDTRVASRRLRAALEAFQDMLPPEAWQACNDSVKSITRTLGRAREEEVTLALLAELTTGGDLAENLCREYLEERYRRELGRQQQKMMRKLRRLDVRALRSQLDELPRRVGLGVGPACSRQTGASAGRETGASRRRTGEPRQKSLFPPRDVAHDRAHRIIAEAAGPVLAFRPRYDFPRASDERLHRLRIAVKKLRYAMEIFAPVRPGGLGKAVSACRAVQDTAGEYHDWVVLRSRLQAEIRRLTKKETTHFAFQIGRLQAQVEDRKSDRRRAILPALVQLQDELQQVLQEAGGDVTTAVAATDDGVRERR